MADPTDDDIVAAVTRWGNRSITSIVRSGLRSKGFERPTSWVLRQLKRLEREDKVKRVRSAYAVQLCWSVIEPEALPDA